MRSTKTDQDPNGWRALARFIRNTDGSIDLTLGAPAGRVAIVLILALFGKTMYVSVITWLSQLYKSISRFIVP